MGSQVVKSGEIKVSREQVRFQSGFKKYANRACLPCVMIVIGWYREVELSGKMLDHQWSSYEMEEQSGNQGKVQDVKYMLVFFTINCIKTATFGLFYDKENTLYHSTHS